MRYAAVGIALTLAASAAAQPPRWLSDLDAARAQAARENRDVYLYFTGSDWCIYCRKMDAEIHATPEFRRLAAERFVLVAVDFPRNRPLQPAQEQKNRVLMAQYGVAGFPTVILLDSKGRAYGRTGYLEGGWEKTAEQLEAIAQWRQWLSEAVEEAEKAQGPDRARKLDEVLDRLQIMRLPCTANLDIVRRIIDADPDNQAALRGKYTVLVRLSEAEAVSALGRHQEAVGMVEAVVREVRPEGNLLQECLFFRAQFIRRSGNLTAAMQAYQAARDCAPEGPRVAAIREAMEELSGRKPR